MAAAEGVDGLEINLSEEGAFALDKGLRAWQEEARIATDCGLALPSISTALLWQYALTSPNPTVRQKGADVIRAMMELAAQVGADTVLVVPGLVSPEVTYADAYQRSQEALSGLAAEAEQLGVTIGIENVWNKFLLSPLECKHFIEEIGHPRVGMYLDVGNVLPNGYPEQWIDLLNTHVQKVHVKDFRLDVGNILGFTTLFQGDVNWDAVLAALARLGYTDYITAEIPPGKGFPAQSILETIRSLKVLCQRYSGITAERVKS